MSRKRQAEDATGLVLKHISNRAGKYPYGAVHVFARDVRVIRAMPAAALAGGGVRGLITHLSRQSRSRLLLHARNLTQLTHMVTLTYPQRFSNDGRRVKRDWDLFRKWMVREDPELGGLWILEFQARGAPHLHVFINRKIPYQQVSLRWFEIVGSGDEKHLLAGTKVELLRKPTAVGAYASKYAAKLEQKAVPKAFRNVGRLWGTFNISLESTVLAGKREVIAPLIRQVKRFHDSRRRRRGLKKWRDAGTMGFTAYDVGPGTRQLLARAASFEDSSDE